MISSATRFATLIWGGQQLELLPQRALYWPAASTLFITDPHFGKGAVFRQKGLPVPRGGTTTDLAILETALSARHTERLVILGDFFHARTSRTAGVLDALQCWRDAHASLDILLVRGNHDDHAGDPPSSLNIRCVSPPWSLPPFICLHHPIDSDDSSNEADNTVEPEPETYALAGHLHPVAKLCSPSGGGATLRLPCFHFGAQQALLPAFGRFTGGYSVRPKLGDRVFVVGEDAVIEASLA